MIIHKGKWATIFFIFMSHPQPKQLKPSGLETFLYGFGLQIFKATRRKKKVNLIEMLRKVTVDLFRRPHVLPQKALKKRWIFTIYFILGLEGGYCHF